MIHYNRHNIVQNFQVLDCSCDSSKGTCIRPNNYPDHWIFDRNSCLEICGVAMAAESFV